MGDPSSDSQARPQPEMESARYVLSPTLPREDHFVPPRIRTLPRIRGRRLEIEGRGSRLVEALWRPQGAKQRRGSDCLSIPKRGYPSEERLYLFWCDDAPDLALLSERLNARLWIALRTHVEGLPSSSFSCCPALGWCLDNTITSLVELHGPGLDLMTANAADRLCF